MRLAITLAALATCVLGGAALARQDSPVDIPKNDLPKKALCVVCEAGGAGHAEEKPAAGVRYRGKTYFFCAAAEAPEFKKDPEAFMPPVLPRPAPRLPVKTLEGRDASLADYKGKVVLVDFWATWCKPCVAAMPDLQKLHDRLSARGFAVVGVSIDETGAKAVSPFLQKRKVTYPVVLDGTSTWKTWGVRAIPAMFLVDQKGTIVKQWTGKANKKEVERAVTELLK
jgi:cytochrome c biogenesis protein CcmG/thiol:disulfide interchange protein DsbE